MDGEVKFSYRFIKEIEIQEKLAFFLVKSGLNDATCFCILGFLMFLYGFVIRK